MTWDAMAEFDHEQVSYFHDEETGLRCVIGIYDTRLGPALGGTRIWDYDSEEDALQDVLRLSKGMAYKAAAADLDLGGGKAVIMGDPDEIKTEQLLRTYGRAVQSLNGRYITAEDVNTEVADMDTVAEECDYVVGLSAGLGNPSPVTAHGVFHGMKACLHHVYGDPSVDGVSVLVQGVGKVGAALVETLVENGADVKVSDIDTDAVEEMVDTYGVEAVDPDDVYTEECDVFAPCALGGVINDDTIPGLQCDIVAGSANNVLAERRHATELEDRGILYAPDYVINAGGLITVHAEMEGRSKEDARDETENIHGRLEDIIEKSGEEDISTVEAADEYAQERMQDAEGKRFKTLSHGEIDV
ncbi:MAG: Glu/Leu/Phe/Val dehydrogenase dimerization domain-containing protein [Candidatus Nanohaloarchaea archaeon]|nr:Glu/Leu/Phe/Val dehydrogenase dimerization domain-containing protein [Candidatus Nanohaloarchaea archaeon]